MQTTTSKDRYEIVGTLGTGATSRVDKARDMVLGRTVALKTLVHSFGAPVEQKQFLREAQIVSQLSHPAIVNLYDVGFEEGNIAYLVMEYVAGKTLQQVLSSGSVPFPRACAWAADLAGALGGAHRAGIIHGDIKPANILVTEDGKVKLGDFGIARFATQVSRSGQLMGTPAYLSPEQILGEPQSTRSDLFSLGIVLYQMITGVPPFEGSSVSAVCAQILSADPVPPSQRNPGLPDGIDHVVLRCLAKSPADRYPSADALAASLYPFSRETRPPSTPQASHAANRTGTSWLARPMQASDAWITGAVLLLAAGGWWLHRAAAPRLSLPPAPAAMIAAPKPPKDFREPSEPSALAFLGDGASASNVESRQPIVPQSERRLRTKHAARSLAADPPSRAILPPKPDVHLAASVPAPDLAAPAAIPIARTVEHAPLKIEIDSAVPDGALAIFADQTMVYTTELHGGKPVELERTLTTGPHELRVALYRPDKGLQVMKEGLAEIRADSPNALVVHVLVKSKLLVKRERSLEVTWPSAIKPSSDIPARGNLSASTTQETK